MSRLLHYLMLRPRRAAALAAGYAAATTLSHDVGQAVVFWLQDLFGARLWLPAMLALSATLGLLLAGTAIRRTWGRSDRAVIAGYAALTCALASAGYLTLMMVSNECIHFLQYAILAMLIFPVTRRYGETVAWCILIGAIDEGYQYFALHAHWSIYYDFNDVVLNAIGAGLGVVLVRALAPVDTPGPAFTARRPGYLALATLLTASLSLALAGYLTVNPPADVGRGAIVLRRSGPPAGSWTPTTFGKGFHELLPLEGTGILLALLLLYVGLDLLQPARVPADALDALALSPTVEPEPPAPE